MSEKILSFCNISGNSVKDYQGSRKYIATGDIVNNKICSYTEVEYKNKPSRANQEAELGDVLFAKMKETRKVICITEDNVDCIYSTGFYVIKPKQSVLTEYLYWLFNSSNFNRNKDKLCKGATQKALNNEGLKKIAIKKLPIIEEQKNIVSKLNKISGLINSKMEQLELLDELIKSQFVEMFGDVGKNDRNWKYTTLGKECFLNPKKSELKNMNENFEVSFVAMPSVSENGNIDTNIIKKYDDVKKGFTYFAENDVLFAKITPCMENGKGAVAVGLKNKIGFGSTEFHVLRPKENINSVWLYTLTAMKSFRIEAERKMTGSAGQKRVPISFFETYNLGLPPIELQNQFADIVKQIDKQKFEIDKSLKEMQELYESLMEKYFG